MKSRMERYDYENSDNTLGSRAEKHEKVYNEINNETFSRVKASENIKVLNDSPKDIDIEKIKKYLSSNNIEAPTRKPILRSDDINVDVFDKINDEEEKDYDILSVLEKAKENRSISYEEEKYKKVSDFDLEILNRLKVNTKVEEAEVVNKEDLNTDERTLVDLINTIKFKKEETSLLNELLEKESSDVALPIEEEIKVNEIKKEELKEGETPEETEDIKTIDKSFYTNSLSFNKKDFEGLETLEKSVKKSNAFGTFLIVAFIIIVVVTLVIVANYYLELGLF